MTSTFFGINTALRALTAQKMALDTTAHNVANANTEGFTRQSVVLRASDPFTVPAISRDEAAGQMGTGVDVVSISRQRDTFVDAQLREQLASLGTANTRSSYLEQVESLMNEPSTSGINTLLNKMYAAWSDLANESGSYVAKAAAVQTGSVLADAIRRVGNQLAAMSTAADGEIDSKLTDVNSSLKEIFDLNKQIVMVKAAGDQPNDLMDRRDLLLDKIAQVLPVGYHEEANGAFTVWVGSQAGPPGAILVQGTPGSIGYATLVRNGSQVDSSLTVTNSSPPPPTTTTNSTDVVPAGSDGEVRALLDLKTVDLDPNNAVGKGVAWRLEQMAVALTNEVNAAASTVGGPQTFFSTNGAGPVSQHIIVDSAFTTDPGTLAAGDLAIPGDGQNALAVVHLQSMPPAGFTIGTETITVNGWYQKMIAQLGIDSKQAQALASNQKLLVDHVKTNRESQSGVSLDEEASNMIRFERAYQAAARTMTVMDEMLDKIINGMGVVGR